MIGKMSQSLPARMRRCIRNPHEAIAMPTRQLQRRRAHQSTNSKTSNSSSSFRNTSKDSSPTPNSKESLSATATTISSFGIGSFAGVLGSLAGMGGGFVMIPLLTSSRLLTRPLTQHQAHGTSLFAVTTTGIAGAWGYQQGGQVDYEAAAAIALCGMVTARLGATTTTRLSAEKLKRALGIFMLCVAPMVPAKSYLKEISPSKPSPIAAADRSVESISTSSQEATTNQQSFFSDPRRLVVPAVIGSCSGFLAGLFGVGGGAIVVPALTIAMPDMSHHQALGTSLCAMVLPAMSGTWTHYQKGNVALRVAPLLSIGAFLGAYGGSRYLGLHIEESKLQWGFCGLMVVLGCRSLLK